jgi:hypothetical protein
VYRTPKITTRKSRYVEEEQDSYDIYPEEHHSSACDQTMNVCYLQFAENVAAYEVSVNNSNVVTYTVSRERTNTVSDGEPNLHDVSFYATVDLSGEDDTKPLVKKVKQVMAAGFDGAALVFYGKKFKVLLRKVLIEDVDLTLSGKMGSHKKGIVATVKDVANEGKVLWVEVILNLPS